MPSLREAAFDLSRIDRDKRTVEVVWSTGAAVDRRKFDWDNWRVVEFVEKLDVSAAAVRMERLNSGAAPVLDGHDYYSVRGGQVGVVERAWIADGVGRAVLRFSARDDVAGLWRDVQDGIVRNVSVGYDVHKWETVRAEGQKEEWTARDWTPLEISMVPIGADPDAGTRARQAFETRSRPEGARSATVFNRAETPHREENAMANGTIETTSTGDQPVVTRSSAETAGHSWTPGDMKKIGTRAAAFGLTAEQAMEAMAETRSLEAATDWLQEKAAARSAAVPRQQPKIEVLRDEGDTLRRGIGDAILARANPQAVKLDEAGRQWRGLTLMEMGREYVEQTQGVRLRGLSRMEMAGVVLGLTRAPGAHSTSDFPLILANTANKRLQAAYDAQPSGWKRFCRQSNATDFKTRYINRLSEAPRLEKVVENGEFKYGSVSEQGESYALSTYGKIISITRQALINDDLGAFDRLPTLFAAAAADNEADIVWGIVTTNGAMSDSVALFHASHGNLAGSAAAISVTSLGAARAAMRLQKNVAGKQLINVQPSYLLVPAALETVAEQFIAQNLIPAQASNVVPEWVRSLTPIVEPRLDAASAVSWYLAADPARIDTIEYAYLDGAENLFTETRVGFEVDGVEIKVRQDFAAKAIDWRGLYKNAGA